MPLHRAIKGDRPLEALSQLIRRIERGGGHISQILEAVEDSQELWLVQAFEPHRPARPYLTRGPEPDLQAPQTGEGDFE